MYEEHDDVNQVNPASPDFKTELADQIAELAPEVVADGKIDSQKLRELLSDDVDSSPERFGLFWPGKRQAIRMAQTPTTATLKPDKENSKDWDTTQNVFIEGDNLEVLKILQNHYYGKIKMIYIDPPYNTGKDFVYKDDFKDGVKNYLEWSEQVNEEGQKLSSNAESEGRYHSNWLNMMYPRLKLARNLLTDDGVIAIHIDENETANLEALCREIFGESNFLGCVIWDKKNPKGDPSKVSYQHESILFFARRFEIFAEGSGLVKEKKNGKQMLRVARKIFERSGGDQQRAQTEYQEWLKKQNLTGGEAAYRFIDQVGEVYQPVSMAWPNKRKAPAEYFIPLPHPVTGEETPVPARGWRNPPDTMAELLSEEKIIFGNDASVQPRRKYLLRENLDEKLSSVVYYAGSDDELLKELEIPFDTLKPVALAQLLIESVCQQGDTILDFFAGSGTAAHACMLSSLLKGDKRFILVQIPEPVNHDSTVNSEDFDTVAEICRERIRRAGEKIKEDFAEEIAQRGTLLDVGFRSYKLVDTNFAKWNLDSSISEQQFIEELEHRADTARDDALADDLLTELLLKQGLSLTETVENVEIAGLRLKGIRSDDPELPGYIMLVYLDEHTKPSLEQLREVTAARPGRLVILEDAFGGDDELKTNLVQMCKTNSVELWTA